MLKKIILPFLLICTLISCDTDEEVNPFPIIETVNHQVYATGGVKLEGNIHNVGTSEVLEYGFELFASGNNVYYNVNHHVALPATQGQFFLEITQELYPDLEYFYTAYIRTTEDIYRGERLSFISTGSATPVLLQCTPNIAHIGDTVTLHGENFPTDINDIEFKFGGAYAQIESVNENELTFIVPKPNGDSRILEIDAYHRQVVEDGLLSLYQPVITATNPTTAFFGETIRIIGDHFATNINYTSVTIGGFDAQIIGTSRNEIEVIIPEDVNYSNTLITVNAQNQNANYTNFNLKVPQYVNVPNMVFMDETFDITVDATHANQNRFMIGDREYYPTIVDDTTLRFHINSTAVFEQREQQIKWLINDIEVISPQPITISNPFYKIKDGYNNNFPFAEYDLLTVNNQALVIGDIAHTDARKYIYTYNDVSRTWENQALVNDNGSPHAFGYNDVSYVSKEGSNMVYGLKVNGFTDNFIRIDVTTGNVTLLTPNSSNAYYGKGFAHQNKVFYTTPTNSDVWAYDITNETWQIVSTLPYDISAQRNSYISPIVAGDYVYIANGANGSQFNDFWRMNLNTYQWEQLANNPYPKKYGTVYEFNNELHFVTDQIWKYNLASQTWSQLEKPGVSSGLNEPIDAFMQNGIPYLIRKNVATNVTYLNLYIGDLVN